MWERPVTATLQPFDSLAPCAPGVWRHGNVTVTRSDDRIAGGIHIVRSGGVLEVRHSLTADRLSDALVGEVTDRVSASGSSRSEFEAIMVGLVRSTVPGAVAAWATFYRNSLIELTSGTSDFAPIHACADDLVDGDSVLDLGSCFGFFPLRLASRGVDVIATDLHGGTVRLLDAMTTALGLDVATLVCDAASVPVPDAHVDTVTALHLLEHVDLRSGDAIVQEALRVARRRVVIAVPFEEEAERCHGHVRTFDLAALASAVSRSGAPFDVFEHHGGWAVLDAR
ncbi:class I SAM-dependent methyltransferase [Rhodococcus sp. BP-332]|uniref:mycofactocin oligosaccharide methyltransferase MftM n=1 Tax=Rhodococcus sp. BP-332 TaxID=2739447 RepID=UPI001C9B4135|nr:mycofactocin oligosaccharide methyltransferase MftM [Rhodococcus sp. BP-332]MBY6678842.1 class I SAM-dependent methyltransferase [Rhodococcus sp. BP-332]